MRLFFLSVVVLTFAAAVSAAPIGVTVNGACVAGSCPPSVLAIGGTDTQNFDYTLTLANNDVYRVFGNFSATNSSGAVAGAVNHAFEVLYEGNGSGGASAAADTITVEGLYTLATGLTSELGFRSVIGSFGGGISGASSGSSCLADGMGCVSVHAPGAFSVDSSEFTAYSSSGVFDYNPYFTSDFAAGSPAGSYIVWGQDTPLAPPPPTTPEPGSVALLAVGLGVICVIGKRIRLCAR
ncbi:MAG TPA: PEP-CTERM sorting domain-containing protein [Bryobacteraceae bacterium]|jgi:hypothetical protein|nr:PEP-CTERM sorting domain-containing protein [Bryobacteraceae bacterium]